MTLGLGGYIGFGPAHQFDEDSESDSYEFKTYNLNGYLWANNHVTRRHVRKVSRYTGKRFKDLNYNDAVLVGTFVPGNVDLDKRNLPEYRDWRMKVFKRDSFTCRKCGSKFNLQAHHIKQVAFYPDLIFDVDNGLTLCEDCHDEIPVFRRR